LKHSQTGLSTGRYIVGNKRLLYTLIDCVEVRIMLHFHFFPQILKKSLVVVMSYF